MSDLWWSLLKAPLYDRVDRDPAYVRYLEQSGQTPARTRLRQTDMGQEVPAVPPQSTVGAEIGYTLPRLNNPNAKGSPFTEDNRYQWEGKNKNFSHFYQSDDEKVRAGIKHLGDNIYMLDHYAVREGLEDGGHGRAGLIKLKEELEAHHGGPVQLVGTDDVVGGAEGFWRKMANEGLIEDPFGEELNKEAKSPAALAHKRKYETEYESSPARKKYRRELGAERRKRGVAGKGGPDMSHTKTGKIVPEDPHTNRARSHPSVGSTLKMVVVKAPQMNLMGTSAECELCGAGVDAQTAQMMNQQFGATVCMACIQQEQERINQKNDMMYHGAPMDIAMRLLKGQKKLFVQGQKTLDGRPAFTPTDFAADEQRRQAALKEAKAKEQRMIAVQQHEAMTNKERMARTEADRLKEKQAREAQQRKAAEGNATLPQFQQNPE